MDDLRRRAEELAKANQAKLDHLSPEDAQVALHELQVHQIELEMQNEELLRVQADLEAARTKYFDLYDLAPVGYLTISEKGGGLEANLAIATLLGLTRSALINHPLHRFILMEDQDLYYFHRKKLIETGEPQTCELHSAHPGYAFSIVNLVFHYMKVQLGLCQMCMFSGRLTSTCHREVYDRQASK